MEKLLMTPGPTNVPKVIRDVLAMDLIHHRMDDFKIILERLTTNLNTIFKSSNDTIILTASGTGGMEASVLNLFNPNELVLVIDTGFFGERFKQLATMHHLNVLHLKYDWGHSYDLEEVQEVIKNNPDLKGIFVTHSETSTGVLNDIESIAKLTKDTDILLVVDAISGLVVNPFEFDEWGVDCAISSSQKGFLLPPGLCFVNLSNKAFNKLDEVETRTFYFDFKKYYKMKEIGQTPYTPAINIILAADHACEMIVEKGLANIQEEYTMLRNKLEEGLVELGFKSFLDDHKGNTLVSVVWDFEFDVVDYLHVMDEKYDIKVANGQGPYKDKMLRFGCIGPITIDDINKVLEATREYFRQR